MEIDLKKGMEFRTSSGVVHKNYFIGNTRTFVKEKLLEMPKKSVEITNITGTHLAVIDMIIVEERFKSGAWILI